MDNLSKIGRSLMDNWGGGGIMQLINILFCGYPQRVTSMFMTFSIYFIISSLKSV